MSTQFPLRLDDSLDTRVREIAADRGISINTTLNRLIRTGIESDDSQKLARSRLNDPDWIADVARTIRERERETLDRLAE